MPTWIENMVYKNVPRGAGISDKKCAAGGAGLCKIVQKVGALYPPHPVTHSMVRPALHVHVLIY